MGITIHYHGKAKNLEAIDTLIDIFTEIAVASGWQHRIIHDVVKGIYEPWWGIGYGFVPSKEEIVKHKIEFFPEMVSSRCNGYFRLFKTKYQDEVRTALNQGTHPRFSINTKQKGIQIDLHPRCETLCLIFDLKTLELIDYSTDKRNPDVIYGIEGFSCKTQFAGFETHHTVCKLLKMASQYIDFSDIDDESGFFDTGNIEATQREFNVMRLVIQQLGQTLKEMGMDVVTGDEL